MNDKSPRILVLDSHPVIREGLIWHLSSTLGATVNAAPGGFEDGLRRIEASPHELVISDFQVNGGTALSFLERLGKLRGAPRCLIFSAHDEMQVGYPCIRAGASGFVAKDAPLETLKEAVTVVLKGRHFLSANLSKALMNGAGKGEPGMNGARCAVSQLSDRELEVFTLIGGGMKVAQIAERLGVSKKTVEAHRDHIKNKLGCDNSSQVLAAAVRWLDASNVVI
jgi:DNA-binding NarL/FixJ family response regulator